MARRTGFDLLHYQRIVPRMEAGKPISGQLLVFEGMRGKGKPKAKRTPRFH